MICMAIVLCIQTFAAPGSAAIKAKDEQAAREVLADYVESWNRHDMKAHRRFVRSPMIDQQKTRQSCLGRI